MKANLRLLPDLRSFIITSSNNYLDLDYNDPKYIDNYKDGENLIGKRKFCGYYTNLHWKTEAPLEPDLASISTQNQSLLVIQGGFRYRVTITMDVRSRTLNRKEAQSISTDFLKNNIQEYGSECSGGLFFALYSVADSDYVTNLIGGGGTSVPDKITPIIEQTPTQDLPPESYNTFSFKRESISFEFNTAPSSSGVVISSRIVNSMWRWDVAQIFSPYFYVNGPYLFKTELKFDQISRI